MADHCLTAWRLSPLKTYCRKPHERHHIPAFWAPVTIRLPGDDGELEIIECRGRFKRLKKSERIDLDRRALQLHDTR